MANHKKSRRWIWVVGLLPILGGAAFFSLKAVGKGSTKIDPAKLVKVERIDLTRSVVAVGKIEAANKVEIKSKASGIIEKLPFLKRDLERARTLFAGGLIAPQARDESEKQYEMALNRQRSATANLAVSQ